MVGRARDDDHGPELEHHVDEQRSRVQVGVEDGQSLRDEVDGVAEAGFGG